ncbi:hypothetical protein Tdes44962_MAKER06136 [Teratosphaeria destructans]|uniref:Tocopherol cyclase n=1 Tax=Teratosphaeria destructans TaxID=418781 RepID=A0A9W7SI28_9PEZI|nr:hypothetical protein Tdes44962_MAKER06136 [Teratosphaeria destructans]
MEHHAPHRRAAFEGYYSKFDLPSGAHIALIVCQVRGAKSNPHVVSFNYVPQDVSRAYQKDVYVDNIDMVEFAKDHSFGLEVKGLGYARWNADATAEYRFDHDDFSFHGKTTSPTPWSSHTSTPEALLAYLPLPLHWHVQSLASKCDFQMKLPGYDLPEADRSGQAMVHEEKNWAQGFPSAHMWLQARNEDSSFCAAGGQIMGMDAFLVGYRSKGLDLDFRPPFSLRFLGLGPFLSYAHEWENREFELDVKKFGLYGWHKLEIKATAPKGTFFTLSAPFPEGFRENFLAESFQARFEIKVYESGWFTGWNLVRKEVFTGSSLEFGGGYYPPAGSKRKNH